MGERFGKWVGDELKPSRKPLIDSLTRSIKRGVLKMNPFGSSVNGSELTPDEKLVGLSFTKKGFDAMGGNEGKPPFDHKWKEPKI